MEATNVRCMYRHGKALKQAPASFYPFQTKAFYSSINIHMLIYIMSMLGNMLIECTIIYVWTMVI